MPTPARRAKRKEKDDARQLWSPSPSPTEDWGSDGDRDFRMEIVGEEVGYNGNMKYEVHWEGWKRSDGTSTTWEGPSTTSHHLPTLEWTAKRLAALPNTPPPDIQLWGTTDIVNTRTRELKQGYEEPTPNELAEFQEECAKMMSRMEKLMVEKKTLYPHLWPQDPEGRTGIPAPARLPRRSQIVNAQAGPSRLPLNAEAGPSRLRPRDVPPTTVPTSRTPVPPPTATSSSRLPPSGGPAPVIPKPRTPVAPIASPSRLRAISTPKPSIPIPPRRGSPAISVSSSADSIEFLGTNASPQTKPLPKPSGVKRKATSPVNAAPPPPPKRRALPIPVPRDPLSTGRSGSASLPNNPTSTSRTDKDRPGPNASPARPPPRPPSATTADKPPGPLGSSRSTLAQKAFSRTITLEDLPKDTTRSAGSSTRTSTSAADKTRPNASPKPQSTTTARPAFLGSAPSTRPQKIPSEKSFEAGFSPLRKPTTPSAGPSTRASASATPAPSMSHPLPRRLLKRRAPDDDDYDDDSPRYKVEPQTKDSNNDIPGWTTPSSGERPRTQSSGGRMTRSNSIISTISSSSRTEAVGKTAASASTAIVPRPPSLPVGSLRKGKARETVKSLRLQTETTWSALALSCDGAAGITFVNDIDDEEIPASLHGGEFVYLEDKYHPGKVPFKINPDPDAATPFTEQECFPFCQHKHEGEECDDSNRETSCQDSEQGFAYTEGLFNFTYRPNDVVVECNPYCTCPETCRNRVAQRPRRFPVEIFKTARYGWGVRVPEDIMSGTVLGVYTGKLITRRDAEALTGEAKQYCFDLDYSEEDDAPSDERYSVDSMDYGNWTRFINHSCAPNLRVQPVVHDTLPQQYIAFLAFIAIQRIPAGTELTFDYDPEAQYAFETARRMGAKRTSRPPGANDCECGAGVDKCRGWVRT
ncbi:hypothetical protein B0H19DRAFT_1159235 [Mycena capillaripes]|nr:hypothetical protein B0H19DRAFT_1159235 [Mycena capillaripes]